MRVPTARILSTEAAGVLIPNLRFLDVSASTSALVKNASASHWLPLFFTPTLQNCSKRGEF